MSLLALPLELFQAISKETIKTLGICESFKLRLVSKLFDAEIQRTMYALPIFDNHNAGNFFEGFDLPAKMSVAMTSRLLLMKLRSHNASKRPFCAVVNRTLAFFEELDSEHVVTNQEITDVIIEQAASSSTLTKLVEWLSPSGNSTAGLGSTMENAIVVAVATNRPALLRELLQKGGNICTPTAYLGDPLHMAGKTGSEDMIRVILDHELREKADVNEAGEPYVRHRLRKIILKAATKEGRENIVRIVLEKKYHTGQPGRGYSKAINNAIEGNYQAIAVMLLLRRKPVSRRPAYWERSWYKRICSEIVSRNLVEVMRTILQKSSISQHGYLDAPLQQSIKNNKLEMARLIASHASSPGLSSFPVALMSAAEHGHRDILDTLLERGGSIDLPDNVDDARHVLPTAATEGNFQMVQHILTKEFDLKRNNCGTRALTRAAVWGSRDIVELLLDAGVSAKKVLEPVDEDCKLTHAMETAKKIHPEIVAFIKERSATEVATEVATDAAQAQNKVEEFPIDV